MSHCLSEMVLFFTTSAPFPPLLHSSLPTKEPTFLTLPRTFRMTICEDDLLWQSLFFRDFGNHPSLGEATASWKEWYKECSLVVTWNPDVVDDQGEGGEHGYIFSEGNRKIFRDNGKGFFPKVCSSFVFVPILMSPPCPQRHPLLLPESPSSPPSRLGFRSWFNASSIFPPTQAISSKPVRGKHLEIAMFFCGEIALVHKNSSEEVKDWLGTFPRNHLRTISGQDVEFCFLSMYERNFGGWVGGNKVSGHSGFPSPSERMDIDLDFYYNSVRWTCKSTDPPISATCPIPKRPFFVLFNTGAMHAGAEFINPLHGRRYASSW